ncbi:MAG: Gfo/Idh/MocA family oxidoreductase [Clostridia bacterium]
MKKTLNVAMIGGGFMGKAHSNAWLQVNKFFDAPFEAHLKVIVGNRHDLADFARNWGYDEVSYDWRAVMAREDIDIVDIGVPPYLHHDMVLAAAKAGKHIVCEKPCGMNYRECVEMAEAADAAGVVHYVNHNYRRVPAVAFAKQLLDEGRLGEIYEWRGAYLQDWIMDPDFPLTWHLVEEKAGGGVLFDLGSHAVDLARFMLGEPESVSASMRTFIKERPLPGEGAATFSKGESSGPKEMGNVTVDDAVSMTMAFPGNVLGSIDLSRFACGRRNYHDFEIYASKGALKFNFERMNELSYLDFTAPATEQGFRRILCTEHEHPYEAAWWPSGHPIGYENTFTNAFYDFLSAIDTGEPVTPNLWDGAKVIRVLEAAKRSDAQGRKVAIDEIQR